MSNFSTEIDWAAFFFDIEANWPDKLLALANKRFAGNVDAESAYNFAFDEITADDWSRLRKNYQGTGSPQGFLRITFVRLLEEYAVRKYGKRRPPVWVKRLGTMWIRIFELLCLKRMLPETIIDMLSSRNQYNADLVREAIVQVRGRIHGCGQYVGEWVSDSDIKNQTDAEPSNEGPEPELEEAELAQLLGGLAGLLGNSVGSETGATIQRADYAPDLTLIERRNAVRERLKISDTERLILRLIYHDGYTIPKAAKAIRLHEQKVRRTHKSLLKKIRLALDGAGLDAAALGRFAE